MINPELLGVYVNPDEIEKKILEHKILDLRSYGIVTTQEELLNFLKTSTLLKENEAVDSTNQLRFIEGKLNFENSKANPYFPSVISDFIHNKLISSSQSFTFETVMSFPGKIDLLQKAQNAGYRTYLYYIATEDSDINISRVHHRIKMGGHSVPENKIRTRYQKSLDLLMDAIQVTNRAYIFDNSRISVLLRTRSQRIRTIAQLEMQVKIPCHENVPIYQVLSEKIKELKALKMTNRSIALKLRIDRKTVAKGLL
jgi:predicted ABC-type ATPase